MTLVRVFIGTTEGAAQVQSITEEDAGVQSVICLNGRAVALPVSPEYDSFVRRPTGLIEAAYGHAAYRVDVSLPIEEGRSWQLGVLAAHALGAARRLATGDAQAGHVIWLTGEVDRHLGVHPVAHLSEKLRRASPLVAECKAHGVPITLYVPRANFTELDSVWLREQGFADAKCRVVPVDRATDLFSSLKISFPGAKGTPKGSAKPGLSPSHGRLLTYLTAVTLVAAIAALLWFPPRDDGETVETMDPVAEIPDGLRTTAVVSRPPANHDCAAIRRGQASLQTTEQALLPGPPIRTTNAGAICQLAYVVETGDDDVGMWIFTARSSPLDARVTTKVRARHDPLGPGESYEFTVPLPGEFQHPLVYELAVVSLPHGEPALVAKLDALADRLGGAIEPDTWRGIIEELEASGAPVKRIVHEITP